MLIFPICHNTVSPHITASFSLLKVRYVLDMQHHDWNAFVRGCTERLQIRQVSHYSLCAHTSHLPSLPKYHAPVAPYVSPDSSCRFERAGTSSISPMRLGRVSTRSRT